MKKTPYFSDDNNNDTKSFSKDDEYYTFIKIIGVMIGSWWACASQRESIETIRSYAEQHLIDVSYTNKQGQSLYHMLAAFDQSSLFEILLTIDSNVNQYKDQNGKVLFCFVVLILQSIFFLRDSVLCSVFLISFLNFSHFFRARILKKYKNVAK